MSYICIVCMSPLSFFSSTNMSHFLYLKFSLVSSMYIFLYISSVVHISLTASPSNTLSVPLSLYLSVPLSVSGHVYIPDAVVRRRPPDVRLSIPPLDCRPQTPASLPPGGLRTRDSSPSRPLSSLPTSPPLRPPPPPRPPHPSSPQPTALRRAPACPTRWRGLPSPAGGTRSTHSGGSR